MPTAIKSETQQALNAVDGRTEYSLKRLGITAESENIEATAMRFYEMSTRCIDCHQHLRHTNYQV